MRQGKLCNPTRREQPTDTYFATDTRVEPKSYNDTMGPDYLKGFMIDVPLVQ